MSSSFDRAYRRLAEAFRRYHDVPREPERLHELVDARGELDDARGGVRSEGVRFRASPENPDFVEPGLGTDSNSVAGKVAAVLFAVGAVTGICWGVWSLSSALEPDLRIESVAESSLEVGAGGRCVWRIAGELRNTTSTDIDVEQAWIRTDAGVSSRLFDPFTVPADATVPFRMSFLLADEGCPSDIDDVSAGRIRVNDAVSIDARVDG